MPEKDSLTVKAYRSREFLGSHDARPLRILAEYLEPKSRFEHYKIDDTIVFFGSARIKPPAEAEAALEAARKDAGGEAGDELARFTIPVEQATYPYAPHLEGSFLLVNRLNDHAFYPGNFSRALVFNLDDADGNPRTLPIPGRARLVPIPVDIEAITLTSD